MTTSWSTAAPSAPAFTALPDPAAETRDLVQGPTLDRTPVEPPPVEHSLPVERWRSAERPLTVGRPLTIERMCGLGAVSRAGFYRRWAENTPRAEETHVRDAIQKVKLAMKSYGYRRVTEQLRREGLTVNHKRVLRLMRDDTLLCLPKRLFVPATTRSNHGWTVVPNRARGMTLTGLDQLWVADITYIRLAEEFAYLAVVIDAFSRKVIGWSLERHMEASLVLTALRAAIDVRNPKPDSLIHHSDRGVQYACGDYAALLSEHSILPSMSRIGNPYDNAKAESFMKTLKTEEVDGRSYRDASEARGKIGAFIETVYNRQRLHSALAYKPPAEFEADHVAAASLTRPASVVSSETKMDF
jgi:putative transposase